MPGQDAPVPLSQRRRRPRMRADDVRSATLRAAQELVYDMGIALSLDDLGMEDVIRRAGVPRSSVYRIWPYKGDFVDDLLQHLAGPQLLGTTRLNNESVTVAMGVISTSLDRLADPRARMPIVREALRQAVDHYVDGMMTSAEWRMFMAVKATVHSVRDHDARRRLAEQLNRSETQFLAEMGAVYQALAAVTGLRLRDPSYTWELLALLGASLTEGLVLRRDVADLSADDNGAHPAAVGGDALRRLTLSSVAGPAADGTTGCSPAALVYILLLDQFAEADPDAPWPPEFPSSTGAG